MSDRSALTNLCLLGVLVFLVLSSGVLQCAYNCMEEDATRRASLRHEVHASYVANCHLTLPEPKQIASCPDRPTHQSHAASRSLAGPVLTSDTSIREPLLNGFRLPLPDFRPGQPLKQKRLSPPVLLASWQPPSTMSQTLLSVKTTVLLN